MSSPSVLSTEPPTMAGTAHWWRSSGRPGEPRYETLITPPEMARAVRREKRDIQTVTGTWKATTSPVLITKTGDMVAELPDGPLCPGPSGTPYMPYSTAANRFGRMLDHLGIAGVHTHSLRHQFASEALDADPRELANISQVLGAENQARKGEVHTADRSRRRRRNGT